MSEEACPVHPPQTSTQNLSQSGGSGINSHLLYAK